MRHNSSFQNVWKATERLATARPTRCPTKNCYTKNRNNNLHPFSSTSDSRKGHGVVVEKHTANKREWSLGRGEKSQISADSTTLLNNPNHSDATALVDKLLIHTRELMGSPRAAAEDGTVADLRKHIVAYSGGVDSSLVFALLNQAKCEETESVYGVLGLSPAVPQDQVQLARQVAKAIGAPLVEVTTTEGSDETYIANEGQACLACKTHLYSALEAVAQHANDEHSKANHNNNSTTATKDTHQHPFFRLYNGTNADDVKDTTRVGLIAAQNFHVQSPLRYTTKHQVRMAARHLGLPNWNVAASPCLRSRLALGVEATQEHLQRIELAEGFVKQELGDVLKETSNLRVRLLAENRARLEIDVDLLSEVEARINHGNRHWESYFVKTLGFESISTRAFQSGSVSKRTDNDTSDAASSKQKLKKDVNNSQEAYA